MALGRQSKAPGGGPPAKNKSTQHHETWDIAPAPYALHAANAANLMSSANAPLDIKVNGQRVLRLEHLAAGPRTSVNAIGEFAGNVVSNGAVGVTIAGGGWTGYENYVSGDFASIGGGVGNNAASSTPAVAGGGGNTASGSGASVGGGSGNGAGGENATTAGGRFNHAQGYAAAVGGGESSTASGRAAVVGGGAMN